MFLPLGQLIFTSFKGVGFQLLSSQQIPAKTRQFFLDSIVHQYWDGYEPPDPGQKSAYLNQEDNCSTLFGWLFDDGVDDFGRGNIPYFIAYHLQSELSSHQLSLVFKILERGPFSLISRQHIPEHLDYVHIPESCHYKPAFHGIKASLGKREFCSQLLGQGERLNLVIQATSNKQRPSPQQLLTRMQNSRSIQPIHDLLTGARLKVKKLDDSAKDIDLLVENISYLSTQMNEQVLSVAIKEHGSRATTHSSSLYRAEIIQSLSQQIRRAVVDVESLIQAIQAEAQDISTEVETYL